MNAKDNFTEWYKKRFEEFQGTPPEEAWNSIEQELKLNNWYKQEFEKIDLEPPEDVWNSIHEKLTVNEAWKGVETTLEANAERRVFIRRTTVATLLLLLLFGFAELLLNKAKKTIGARAIFYSEIKSGMPIEQNARIKESKRSIRNKEVKNNLNTGTFLNTVSNNPVKPGTEIIPETRITINTPKKQGVANSLNFKEQTEHPKTAEKQSNSGNLLPDAADLTEGLLSMQTKNILLSNETKETDFRSTEMIIDSAHAFVYNTGSLLRGIYFGGVYSFNNIWLLNNQTFNGFRSTGLDQTNINSGNSYGFAAGYALNTHWATEVNVYLNSQQGQTYHVYEEGRYLSKNVSLNYTVFNLSLRERNTRFIKNRKNAFSYGVIAGINYGYLRSAKNIYNEKTEITKANYHNADFGLRVGYGYELLLFRKLILSGSLQTNIGLKNIYSGTDAIPGSFNRTHTACIGAEFGLKYLLK
ncbi:MAG: hypothetical protein ACXVPN_05075 [Bacteroidia bacterium]